VIALVQFALRLTFGVALAMVATPSQKVTSGFFRVHAYVLLGLGALCGLLHGQLGSTIWPALFLVLASYLAAAAWHFEWHRLGKACLILVAALAAWTPSQTTLSSTTGHSWTGADSLSAGALLGFSFVAMLLGHWYLNTPTMELQPLRRLIRIAGMSVLLRMAICAWGLWGLLQADAMLGPTSIALLVLRWTAGLAGVPAMLFLAWKTLDVPNTQSATGILYVAVIFGFLGESASILLSQQFGFPL
jgi:hypothetical protein